MPEEAQTENTQPAKRRWWLAWLAGLLAVAGIFLMLTALVLGWFEPQYSKRPLSYWLAELNGTNYIRREIAADALGHIGEPAIDPLLAALKKESSLSLQLREKFWRIAPSKLQAKIPRPYPADVMQYNALVGLAALGTNSARVAPDVILIFTNNSPALTSRATLALNRMGSNAYPTLMEGSYSKDAAIADQCQNILVQAQVKIQFIPQMAKLLVERVSGKEMDVLLLNRTASSFEFAKVEASKAINPLLQHQRPEVCLRAAVLLALWGQSNQRIADLLVKDIELPQAEFQRERLMLLAQQGGFLKPHLKEIEKLTGSSDYSIATPLVVLLDQQGHAEPFWKLLEKLAQDKTGQSSEFVLELLDGHALKPEEVERMLPLGRKLLESQDERLLNVFLTEIQKAPDRYWKLLPEVGKARERIYNDSKLDALRFISYHVEEALEEAAEEAKAEPKK